MNKYKINNIAMGSDEEITLAVIQQAVEDVKKSAELYTYYLNKKDNNTFNKYNGHQTYSYREFYNSNANLLDEITESNVFELSYYVLDDAFRFWYECIKRIANNNNMWYIEYNDKIQKMFRAIERWKI